jgi:hypothetical protein
MDKKRIFAVLLSVFALSAIVGAGFANASSEAPSTPVVVQDSDSVDHQCPPDCNAADKADEGTEAPGTEDSATAAETGTEAPDANEAPEAPGESDGPGGNEDPAGNQDHQFDGEE